MKNSLACRVIPCEVSFSHYQDENYARSYVVIINSPKKSPPIELRRDYELKDLKASNDKLYKKIFSKVSLENFCETTSHVLFFSLSEMFCLKLYAETHGWVEEARMEKLESLIGSHFTLFPGVSATGMLYLMDNPQEVSRDMMLRQMFYKNINFEVPDYIPVTMDFDNDIVVTTAKVLSDSSSYFEVELEVKQEDFELIQGINDGIIKLSFVIRRNLATGESGLKSLSFVSNF